MSNSRKLIKKKRLRNNECNFTVKLYDMRNERSVKTVEKGE